MVAEALNDEVAEAVAVRVAVELAAVAENEPALAVVTVHAEDGFPHLGGTVGADGSV